MLKFRILPLLILAASVLGIGACGGGTSSNSGTSNVDPNETAATVNGKVIKMEEVERSVKQQAQGQESNLSPRSEERRVGKGRETWAEPGQSINENAQRRHRTRH